MPNIQAISQERHAHLRWQRHASYAFATNNAVAPLLAAEAPKAALSLPIGFVEQDGAYVPVAVLGLGQRKNLFVAPDGRWLGAYIPATFRSYPFHLGQTEPGQKILCIDEDSGLVDAGPGGERFFNDDGQPAQAVLDILSFLTSSEQNRLATVAACAVLSANGLIVPWPITLKSGTEEHQVSGLFQINEAGLSQLPAEALHQVAQGGGLGLAYCQLLSMQNLATLGQLSDAHAKASAAAQVAPPPPKDLNLDFLSKGGTFSFGALL